MSVVLVVFESKYGQTEKIAEFTRDLIARRGLDARLMPAIAARNADLGSYDAVVVAAPIYFGRHPRIIYRFMRQHADLLSSKPTAFVSVSNSAASVQADLRKKALRIAIDFVVSTGARPRTILTVGGAIAYPRYGFLLRWIMKSIARREGTPTDTSRIHELTDFRSLDEAISAFLDGVAAPAAPEPGTRSRTNDQSGVYARTVSNAVAAKS
jgi:menaquinone-dependent protoporphyrinogen oxidase